MIKIILDSGSELTCNGSFEVTKKLSDISDISQRSGSFSKGITIDGSKDNIKTLGGYFDVNLIASTFDHNKKISCAVEVDGVILEEKMIFRLTDIVKSKKSHSTDTDNVSFKGVVYDDVSSFYLSLGGKLVEDLKVNKPTDAHDLNLTDIRASYYPSVNNRYTYLLPHKESNEYYVNQFIPALYAKMIWDAIFESNGFVYEWSELTDATVQFDKWLIPFTGKYTASDYTRRKGQVIIGQNPNPLPSESPTTNTWTQITYPAHTGQPQSSPFFYGLWDKNNVKVGNEMGGTNLNKTPFYYSQKASYMQVISNEVLDVSNQYNTTTGVFSPLLDSVYDFDFSFDYELDMVTTAKLKLYTNPNSSNPMYLDYEIIPFIDDGAVILGGVSGHGAVIRFQKDDVLNSGSNVVTGTHKMRLTDTLSSSNTYNLMGFSLYVNRINSGKVNWVDFTSGNNDDVTPKLTITDITVTITPRVGWQDNIPVNLNDLLPQKIKQSEFVKSILTLTNSYVINDETQSNKLIIKSRDKFYDDGEIKDFSKYIDVGKESEITFISNDSSKRIELSYKEGNDSYNEAYQSSLQRTYGNASFTLANEHIKGEEKKEISFVPTPYAVNGFGAALPSLRTLPEAKESGIRVLLNNGYKTVPNGTFKVLQSNGSVASTSETYYPEALHCNDPYFPNLDLNFGVCLFYFTPNVVPTANNMYTLNYRRQMNLINSGKKRVSYFSLPEKDRRELKLSDIIKINNSMYIINSFVNNYGVSKQTKIELLTADDDLKVPPYIDRFRDPIGIGTGTGTPILIPTSTNEMKEANNINHSIISSEGNTFVDNIENAFVLGNNNRVASSNVIVVGSNQNIEGEGIYTPNLVVSGINVGEALSNNGTIYFNALFTQSGTNAPTQQTPSTLTVTPSYVGVGTYQLTFVDDIPTNTEIYVNLSELAVSGGFGGYYARLRRNADPKVIDIETFDASNTPINGILNSYIRITQYG